MSQNPYLYGDHSYYIHIVLVLNQRMYISQMVYEVNRTINFNSIEPNHK